MERTLLHKIILIIRALSVNDDVDEIYGTVPIFAIGTYVASLLKLKYAQIIRLRRDSFSYRHRLKLKHSHMVPEMKEARLGTVLQKKNLFRSIFVFVAKNECDMDGWVVGMYIFVNTYLFPHFLPFLFFLDFVLNLINNCKILMDILLEIYCSTGYQLAAQQTANSLEQMSISSSQQSKRLSATDFSNYNTAPRGFSTGERVYHPVMFYNIS